MMNLIGTRDIRSPLTQGGVSLTGHFEALQQAMAASGMSSAQPKVTALVSAYLNDPATTWAIQQSDILAFAKTGMLRAIEGPNEMNNRAAGNGSHGPGDLVDETGILYFPGNVRAWATAIHDFHETNASALAGVAVVAPSIASGLRLQYARLPDLSGLVDAGNIHFYAGGGRQPSYSLIDPSPLIGYFSNILTWARSAELPSGPIWLTETGATTSGIYAPDGLSQAKYIANQMLDYFADGGKRLFLYQLIDASGISGDVEGNFGLFHHDGSPKPAAIMLSRLKDLLSLGRYDDPRNLADVASVTADHQPSPIKVSGTGDAALAGVHALVLAKSDGSSLLAVWSEPLVDDGKGNDVDPEGQTVNIDLGSVQSFSLHDLLNLDAKGGARMQEGPVLSARTLELTVRGYPMLVELHPTTPP